MSESFWIIFAWRGETTGEKFTFYSQNKGKNVLWWDIQNSFIKMNLALLNVQISAIEIQ